MYTVEKEAHLASTVCNDSRPSVSTLADPRCKAHSLWSHGERGGATSINRI
jgi:hypothetical protein